MKHQKLQELARRQAEIEAEQAAIKAELDEDFKRAGRARSDAFADLYEVTGIPAEIPFQRKKRGSKTGETVDVAVDVSEDIRAAEAVAFVEALMAKIDAKDLRSVKDRFAEARRTRAGEVQSANNTTSKATSTSTPKTSKKPSEKPVDGKAAGKDQVPGAPAQGTSTPPAAPAHGGVQQPPAGNGVQQPVKQGGGFLGRR